MGRYPAFLKRLDLPTSTASLQSLPSFASDRNQPGYASCWSALLPPGVTLGASVLTGAPLRVEAKTAGADQKLSPGELVLKSEPRCYGKRPPRPTNQRLAGPVEP